VASVLRGAWGLRRACVLSRAWGLAAAAVALAGSVAGCVNMPDNGPMGAISATPQSTAAAGNFIEPFPSAPSAGEDPTDIVNGFLVASADYPVNATIATAYLTGSAARSWGPGWSVTVFKQLDTTELGRGASPGPSDDAHAVVEATGAVQSAFNGSGQFVSTLNKDRSENSWSFRLVKVAGQWRIANPPKFRLLDVSQFQDYYKAQDLYFVNPSITVGAQDQALVPDSVFVPVGTLATDLATNLVNALIPTLGSQPGENTWLQGAVTTFPVSAKFISVQLAGTTAVVNLSGLNSATSTELKQVSAQLAWTLATPRVAGPPPAIQSVELELNGKPWTPPKSICGVSQIRSPVQTQATYPCYNPYPSQPSGFSFTDHGQVWWRCTAEARAQQGYVGQVFSVFPVAGSASAPSCGNYVLENSTATPPPAPLPAGSGPPSLTAISPDGNYVAYYSPDAKKIFVRAMSTGAKPRPVQGTVGSGVTALSWDNNDNLWIAQNGDVYLAPLNQSASQVNSAPADVTDLSVAPDGVRVAFVAQGASPAQTQVQLAAIITSGAQAQSSPGHIAPVESPTLGAPVQVAPDLPLPDTLTWYDADNLIVLAGSGSSKVLAEVPVDGQDSSDQQQAPPGAITVAADSDQNALVVGLDNNRLAVSTGLEGPWQTLSVPGENPAYPG
jgi:Lipoprotein LpqB beta-propeller domain/Sporulation and spore germination